MGEWGGGAQSSGFESKWESTGRNWGRRSEVEEEEREEVGGIVMGDEEAVSCGMLIGGPLHACVEADDESSDSDTEGKEVTSKWETEHGALFFSNEDEDEEDDNVDDDEVLDVNANKFPESQRLFWEPWQALFSFVERDEGENNAFEEFFLLKLFESKIFLTGSTSDTDEVVTDSHEE